MKPLSIDINRDTCIECGFCEKICPRNAIAPHPEYGFVIGDACVGCGLCVKKCPVMAISKK
ncbi:4Fe-4S binding protein [Chitinivibrio alkaliphilus]|uniref:4Fe-4S ferredoxin-type domain-containing protein n=1 Tax=Chitinivibrio alkaliphilus ACht1 TaxID=1313304 RepID=U7DA20_9BACT|nr:4Fe-4S binding protein [Chitinivibrio alkaliphilus]ERP31947.1 hypothetical protein CALK_1166 [Chitinivibrio alkaliphilus ACht1]